MFQKQHMRTSPFARWVAFHGYKRDCISAAYIFTLCVFILSSGIVFLPLLFLKQLNIWSVHSALLSCYHCFLLIYLQITIIHLPSGLSLQNSDLKRHRIVLFTLLHFCDFNEKKKSPSSCWSEANEKTHAGAADPIQLSLNPSPASPAEYSESQQTQGREKEMFAVISC